MPSEKEIEEAIDWIKNAEFGAIGNSHTYVLINAYLSMKSERDKYKAIVEADESVFSETRTMIEGIARYAQCSVGSLAGLSQSIDFALALRKKES